jgi:hypothetical protein
MAVAAIDAFGVCLPLERFLHFIEECLLDDGLMLAVEQLILVDKLADIDDIGQQAVQIGTVECAACFYFAVTRNPRLRAPTPSRGFLDHRQQALMPSHFLFSLKRHRPTHRICRQRLSLAVFLYVASFSVSPLTYLPEKIRSFVVL